MGVRELSKGHPFGGSDVSSVESAVSRADVTTGAHAPTVTNQGEAKPPRPRPLSNRLRRQLTLEMAAITVVAVLAGFLVSAPWVLVAVTVLSCLVVNYHSGQAVIRPGLPHVGKVVRDMALPLAAIGMTVGFGFVSRHALAQASVIVAASTATMIAMIVLRRKTHGRLRTIVVGDRMAIATASQRWSQHGRLDVVGGLLLAPPDDVPTSLVSDTFGVQTITGIAEAARWSQTWNADLVVVAPGPMATSQQVRELSWLLEDTGVSLSVLGVLDLVSPHRLDCTSVGGVTLMQVRAPKPSAFVRAVKATVDRIVAAGLLLAMAPLLMILAAAVRLDSPGSPFFVQRRVGKDGRIFRMVKLRTMSVDAEDRKAALADDNESTGVLFKMKRDPRVTRVGAILRRTSLDELPQLVNVLKGEMSLIGPRPHLPHEVDQYQSMERRRLAVRPGMTGLWQVSGRSDLNWDRSIELDLRYTDNWSLTHDAVIALRTFDAVLATRGAY